MFKASNLLQLLPLLWATTVGLLTSANLLGQERIVPPDLKANMQFGRAIAWANYVLLCSSAEQADKGGVYAYGYENGAWFLHERFAPPRLLPDDHFGWCIATSGNMALIAARHDDEAAPNAGAVYLYETNAESGKWTMLQKLTPPAGEAARGLEFGSAVALNERFALIGAPGCSDKGFRSGSAHLYERVGTTWLPKSTIVPKAASNNDETGSAVALNGNEAWIGAWGAAYTGAVYVYDADVSSRTALKQTLAAEQGAVGDRFGWSIAVLNDRAVVGAPGRTHEEMRNAGAVYVFQRLKGQWQQVQILLPDKAVENAEFGSSQAPPNTFMKHLWQGSRPSTFCPLKCAKPCTMANNTVPLPSTQATISPPTVCRAGPATPAPMMRPVLPLKKWCYAIS